MVMDVQGGEVARLQAKDAQTFHSLIERLQRPMIGYLYRLVGDYEAALDLTQDTFLQVFKEISKTSADLVLDAWIYRIATNYGLRYLNRKRRPLFVRFPGFSTFPSDEESGLSGGDYVSYGSLYRALIQPSIEDQAETRILIEQAFSLLQPQEAACLRLYYGVGFTYEQIGKIIDVTPEAARKRVTRGVVKFRALYKRASADVPIMQQPGAKETRR
jgi:RNA polymerase sigma-70 factor (ECF subfamily)